MRGRQKASTKARRRRYTKGAPRRYKIKNKSHKIKFFCCAKRMLIIVLHKGADDSFPALIICYIQDFIV